MKSKRMLFVVPLLIGGLLVSCQGGSTSGTESVSTSDSSSSDPYVPIIKEKVTIELWSITGQSTQGYLQNYINEFMSLETNVTVKNTIQTGMGYDELKNAVTTGFNANNYPDLVVAYPDHVAEYLSYGKSVNMQPYFDNEEYGLTEDEKNDYIESFLNEGNSYSAPGIYSLPYCKSTELMFFDEDKMIGLDLSAQNPNINNGNPISQRYLDNLTWEELFNVLCPALKAFNDAQPANAKLYKDGGHVVGYDSDDNFFITLAEQYGYDYTSIDPVTGQGQINFNNPEMKELMKVLGRAAGAGYLFSKGSNDNNNVNNAFTAGECLFSIGSTGGVGYQFSSSNPMNVGVARVPHAEGKDAKAILQGPSITVLDHQDDNRALASWLLWKTITSTKNATNWAINSGYMGVRQSVYSVPEYVQASNPATKGQESLDRLKAICMTYVEDILDETFTSPAFKGSSTARQQVGGIVTNVLIDGVTDDATITKFFDDAENATRLQM